MENKVLRSCLLVLGAVLLLSATFLSGCAVGTILPNDVFQQITDITDSVDVVEPTPQATALPGETPVPTQVVQAETPEELEELFKPFWESWNLLHENYVDQPLDDLALMRGAIQGMLAATGDQHTSYMNPDQFAQANAEMGGEEYTGIGAWVNTSGEYIEIVSPMKYSPAEKAGLRAKDLVIAINGEDMTGIPGDLALQKILGPAGEAVTLTIRRGEEIMDITIVREKITVPAVDYQMLEGDIAYIALYTFNELATDQVRAALKELLAQNPKGLIFDLRNNGGGLLVTSIEIASEFISDGIVMYEEYGDGTRDSYRVQPGGMATEIPLVILINEGTASASEIVAGAIQDYGRGTLIGVTSYGKGSVQNWIPLRTEAGGVRITIARWLTPNGNQINEVGLTPDIEVPYTQEDVDADRDPQLDAAIEFFNQK
ncbi:MAG: S41 family peptidase [Anaerolineaceae bacterium]|jgi:carboxyl-terminal processing protease|nr:S41 family peptidase [Anaerolineaceae bacterium]MDD4042807.1 S41 family peptidase [Anaerolineaceae bacterium]MDD4577497.1 S41 family peptidase [Anaerolineaceae bacterium]